MRRYHLRKLLLIGVVLAALGAALIQPAKATYPGANGRIGFGINVGGNVDVYSVLPDGQDLRRLTDDPGFDACAAYSADGEWIAWCSGAGYGPGLFDIWVMRQDGTEKRRITNTGGGLFPDFSPDGGTIAYTERVLSGLGTSDVYEVSVSGREPRALTTHPANDAFPAYSPDGRKIVFLSDRTGIMQVWLMNADGSGQRQLTFDSAPKDQVPDWSPDGSTIAYVAFSGPGLTSDLWLINADGSGQRRLTSGPESEYGAAWSPDGTRIAFTELASRTVFTIRADGSDRRVVRPLGLQFVPGWQPAGHRPEFPSTDEDDDRGGDEDDQHR